MPKPLHSQLKHLWEIVTTTTTNTKEKASSQGNRLAAEEPAASNTTAQEVHIADMSITNTGKDSNDHLVQSSEADHPANLIPELCRKFYNWGWVTGTGGGVSLHLPAEAHIAIAMSGC